VSPLLAEALHTVTAGVGDGLAGHALLLELGRERLDVQLLVLSLVVLACWGENISMQFACRGPV
jgi:hypothetical protein